MNFVNIKTHWKTTVQPVLTVVLVAAPFATTPGSPIHSPTMLWSITVLAAIAKIFIGSTQKDAGVETVTTPSGDVTAASSHETPDDPKNKIRTT